MVREDNGGKSWLWGSRAYCSIVTQDVGKVISSVLWSCILDAHVGVPGYLRRTIGSYVSNQMVTGDTTESQEIRKIIGGVLQNALLGTLLWNLMYDAVLRLVKPTDITIETLGDDIGVTVLKKNLDDFTNAANKAATHLPTQSPLKAGKLERPSP